MHPLKNAEGSLVLAASEIVLVWWMIDLWMHLQAHFECLSTHRVLQLWIFLSVLTFPVTSTSKKELGSIL
ncbi:hypothetical protein L596_014280 [Steinernema carpocapsae]|uniref:Uncharacterized protein n=1 Tax=Steinernema carpocapsae TaxID=34508 RepID=A0A4U5NC97_STECR|nr:hypothetical protein L596_014280 [Steinernema carpocapsae]